MKKRIMAILFAMTLVAAMLPAGLAVTAAAEENLLTDGGFEDTYEITPSSTPWKGFYDDGMGSRMTYAEAGIAAAPGGGDSCFAIYFKEGDSGKYNQALSQTFDVVPGKTYTVSFLINKVGTGQAINAYVGVGNGITAVADPVYVMYNLKATATSGGWMRATKNFTVPAGEDETVKATFWFRVSDNNAEGIQAYVDNVSVVEAETQERILYTVDGFENMNKLSVNSTFASLAFPTGDNGTNYIIKGDVSGNGTRYSQYKYLTDTFTIPLVTYPDGNTVLQFKTGGNVSYLNILVQNAIDFTGIAKGTPLHISYKARLVNVPETPDVNETFKFFSNGTTVDGLVDQTPYTVTAADETNGMFKVADTEEVVPAGTQVHLVHPSDGGPYFLPMEFSRETVVADDNANEWTQYDIVIPYDGKMKMVTLTSLAWKPTYDYTLEAGYDWELDDVVVSVADTDILSGYATGKEVVRNTRGSSVKITQAWSNADGTGTEYTVNNLQKAHDGYLTIPYYMTALNADKSVKNYAKNGTAAGAAYISAEDAAGASVVTAVYKTVDGDRTLVGVNVKNAAAGLVAAPEVALSAITAEEAGTYEVATYILALTTGTLKPLGESAIVQIQ